MESFKSFLSDILLAELPGVKAHSEAAPYRNVNLDKLPINKAKKSGVLILFYKKKDDLHLVLIKRPTYNGAHSGQISFPGGKVEENDIDIYATALREAKEEVGVDERDVQIIGKISDVYIPVSNFLVTPVIGVIDYAPRFIPQIREVDEIIELKVDYLLNIDRLTTNAIKLSSGVVIKVPTFEYEKNVIWGATALMLNELRHLLKYK